MESWGYHLRINAGGVNFNIITSEDLIKKYLIDLCDLIEMSRFGEPQVVRFGKDPKVGGFSFVQLIEESDCIGRTVIPSDITGHLVESDCSIYIDIFSCKPFNVARAVIFTVDYFEAKCEEHDYTERQAPSVNDDIKFDKYEDPNGSD